MKKYVTLIFAIACFHIAKAQDYSKARIGVQAGGTYSTFSETGSEGTTYSNSYKFGYVGGVFFYLPFNKNWAIQPELDYQMSGGKTEGAFLNQDYDRKLSISQYYLNVPVLAKYHFDHTALSLMAGPQFGVLTKANQNIDGYQTNIKSDFKSNDFSGVIGAEYALPFFKDHYFSVEARYQLGFSDNLKNTTENDNSPMRNRVVSLMLNYSF
ncbi:porin family protein [Rhizosphaericola mali]|uniref:PorT family protein n=1 Tax=Rhizosphaericola mali TaxID=2545455 RepID=A0A5P2FWG1_9BACT|nr:porin family protein [Rhizosphaericola mali]QES87866.1 PorT family protein [Rhizosphaericola mali]